MIARAAALGLALAAGLGGTAFAGRLPTVDAGPAAVAPVRLDIPAATPALVCPGPETAVVPDGAVPVPAPGPFTVTAAAATGAAAGSTGGDAPVLGPLATRRGGAALEGAGEVRVLARVGDPHGPLRLAPTSSSADAAAAARLAAVQVTLARRGDLRGLAAGQCGAAATDAWLVGGATTPGRRARLLLANPTPAPAVVDVRLAGPEGPVDVPSGRGLVVAPGRVRALLLDAAAPGLGQLAVHVVARSGRVTSLLHDSWLRGAVPAGTDDVLPSAAPSRHVVVPGVVVLPGGAARLRVAATGSDDAVVRYHLLGPAGDVEPPGTGVLTVPAGGVADVSLRWVRPGAYAVVLDADAPVAAAASMTSSGPPLGPLRTVATDLAWTSGTQPLTGEVAGAVPRPVDSRHSVVTDAPAGSAPAPHRRPAPGERGAPRGGHRRAPAAHPDGRRPRRAHRRRHADPGDRRVRAGRAGTVAGARGADRAGPGPGRAARDRPAAAPGRSRRPGRAAGGRRPGAPGVGEALTHRGGLPLVGMISLQHYFVQGILGNAVKGRPSSDPGSTDRSSHAHHALAGGSQRHPVDQPQAGARGGTPVALRRSGVALGAAGRAPPDPGRRVRRRDDGGARHADAAGLPEDAGRDRAAPSPRLPADRASGGQGAVPAKGSPEWERWFNPARRKAEESNFLGLETIFLAAEMDLTGPRVLEATATGAFFDQDMLDRQVEYLVQAAEILAAEGIRPGLHNHVGSRIETRYEIEYVMQQVDASLLGASFDIGHLEWAGIPSPAFLEKYQDRLVDLHLKDLDLDIAAASRSTPTPYYVVSDQRFFLEPGLGHIDLPGVLKALGDGFGGWIVIEVDRPSMEPFESAKVTRAWVEENLPA